MTHLLKITAVSINLGTCLLYITGCSTGNSATQLRNSYVHSALAQEPFSFERELPIAAGMKVAHQNTRDDELYYQHEVVLEGPNSLESLESFYTQLFKSYGLRLDAIRRSENSTSFMVWGWPDSKTISVTVIDHSLHLKYPDMVLEKTDHPGMQYRSVNASISRRKQ